MKIDEHLAYWVGAVQSDGCLKSYLDKNRNITMQYIHLYVGPKSLPMLVRFQQISSNKFDRHVKIFKSKKRNIFEAKIGVKKLINANLFSELDIQFCDPPKPPRCLATPSLFGAYLAGIIDGDGNVNITRKKYPQCRIRIASSKKQIELRRAIIKNMNCGAYFTFRTRTAVLENRIISGSTWYLEFYVSKKNKDFFMRYIIPFISIHHKQKSIKEHIFQHLS